MKGALGRDMMLKLVLALMVAVVVLGVGIPLINSAGANAQGCGPFRSLLADISAGAVELC
ncbi:MAG: hypothetical protein ABEJ56_05890 [Candidatus Nanohaloarchaea archaeon]